VRLAPVFLALALFGACVGCVLLWQDNRSLKARVAELQARPVVTAAEVPASASETGRDEATLRGARKGPQQLFGAFGRAFRQPAPEAAPTDDGNKEKPSFAERRERRQQAVKELLGRRPGETEDEYRARVAPLVEGMLSFPRARVEEARAEFEQAAQLSEAQSAAFDQAMKDTYGELVAHANAAVAGGDLTPYRRNTLGILGFVGGTAGIADGFATRLQSIFTPDQLALMDATGFDVLEYLAITTPWETVNPPPPEQP
jgi:hypothetical protein